VKAVDGLIPIGKLADDWMRRRREGEVRAYTTGFRELDEEFGKLLPGTTTTIFGRSGLGKTSLLLSAADRQAEIGIDVLFLSLEMSSDLMLCREIAIRTGISLTKLTEGRLGPSDYEFIEKVLPHFKLIPISISEERDIKKAGRLITDAVEKSSDTILYVDYIGLFRLGRMTGPSGYELMTIFSQELVDLSRILDIPVVIAAQSNRDPDKRTNRRPLLSDLREAGESDSARVIGLYKESFYSRDQRQPEIDNLELHVLKNRTGPLGKIDLKLIGEICKITEWTEEEKVARAWEQASPNGDGLSHREW